MKTYLDWSEYEDAGLGDAYADIPKTGGDYAKAISVCINSMTCLRPIDRGVMCPSFRISKNAAFSPGGRVRLLKKALNSPSAEALFEDPELVEAMDLCVACKGCKRECENNVDMAMIKAEYQAQLMAHEAPSLRQRLLAMMPYYLRFHGAMRTLINLRNRSSWLRNWGEQWLGIAADRDLPELAEQSFTANLPEQTTATITAGKGAVVLLIDTFTDHYSPATAEAAVAVLEAAGYEVKIPLHNQMRSFCCGRTLFSGGYIDQARKEAQTLLDELTPYLDAGTPIVGLEPSCLLMLRDEFKSLSLGEAGKQAADSALLFEEFLAREQMAGRLDLTLQSYLYSDAVMVHGHCHEKAVGAMKSIRKVLKIIPDSEFEFIEASCCGGAGTFGYEAEHSIASLQMAEQALLPKLREKPLAPVISNGFSCREQMKFGADRATLHLAEVLYDHLPKD